MSNSNESKFFDLHVVGCGYVNRIRQVKPNRADPFWACGISALNGAEGNIDYRHFDCNATGQKAIELVEYLHGIVCNRKNESQPEPKILVGFKLGDLYTDTFTRTKGDRAGEIGVSLKARLIYISWIHIDGKKVYSASNSNATEDSQTPSSNAPAAGINTPAPGYNEQAPAPNAPAAGFNTPAPGYNGQAPSSNAPAAGFNTPAPGYNGQAPSSNAPAAGFNTPASGYNSQGPQHADVGGSASAGLA